MKDRLSVWMCLLTPSLRQRARGKERALQGSFTWLCSCREQLSCWETPGERKDTLNDRAVIVKETRVWGRTAKLSVPSDMWSWQNNTLMSRSMWREREWRCDWERKECKWVMLGGIKNCHFTMKIASLPTLFNSCLQERWESFTPAGVKTAQTLFSKPFTLFKHKKGSKQGWIHLPSIFSSSLRPC